MKTDELRHALTDLSGDDPDVDDAFRGVTGRARTQRNHFRIGLVAACVVAIVGSDRRGNAAAIERAPAHRPEPGAGNGERRRLHLEPRPRAVQRQPRRERKRPNVRARRCRRMDRPRSEKSTRTVSPRASIRLRTTSSVHASGTVNDLVGIPGALIAVGRSAGADGFYPDAWRSTDGGHTWHGAAVRDTTAAAQMR